MNNVYRNIIGGYKNNTRQIAFARCNINLVDVKNVDSIPTIKLYPAKEKDLPVEYYPKNYDYEEGYKRFIETEGSFQIPWRSPSKTSLQTGSTVPSTASSNSNG